MENEDKNLSLQQQNWLSSFRNSIAKGMLPSQNPNNFEV
jgi:hypothetical protein